MKRTKLFLGFLLLIATVGITLSLYTEVVAQRGVVEYLREQLDKQGIPVVNITIRHLLPLRLEITVQSASEGEKALPEDPTNLHIVRREITLAQQQGYNIESFTLRLLNKEGKTIFWAEETPVSIEEATLELSSPKVDDITTKNMVKEKLNLYGLTLTNIEVTSSNGIQTLVLKLSTPSVDGANQALPYFMSSLRPLIANINAQGGRIAICKIELSDKDGKVLLKYLLDLQLDSETWWMIDGLTRDWFPHPPSE